MLRLFEVQKQRCGAGCVSFHFWWGHREQHGEGPSNMKRKETLAIFMIVGFQFTYLTPLSAASLICLLTRYSSHNYCQTFWATRCCWLLMLQFHKYILGYFIFLIRMCLNSFANFFEKHLFYWHKFQNKFYWHNFQNDIYTKKGRYQDWSYLIPLVVHWVVVFSLFLGCSFFFSPIKGN